MPKRKCVFSDKLAKDYPYFKQGKNENYAHCKVCCCGISIAHKGRLDIEDHIKTEKHKKNLFNQSGCEDFFVRYSKLVRAAEGTFAFHALRHHDLSIDCTIRLNKMIYHDSEMAKEIPCTRSACETVVNKVLAPYSLEQIQRNHNAVSYVSVECASNSCAVKMYPVLIRYFDFRNGGIQTKLLDIHGDSSNTSYTVPDLVIDTLTNTNLLHKCVAFSGDNCNTNSHGQRDCNVATKLRSQVNSKLINFSCPARLINNAFHHGCDSLLLDIEYIILKIFNHFSTYDVRTEELKEFCYFVGTEYQQLLRLSKTRWLYLFPLLEVVLKFFDALKTYFLALEHVPSVFEMFFRNEFGEAYLYLIHSLTSAFYSNIRQFERSDNSLLETMQILTEICATLREREFNTFIPLKIRSIFNNARKCGADIQVYNFTKEILKLYSTTRKYLEGWLQPLEEFRCFQWMNVRDFAFWDWERDIVPSLTYMEEKGVYIDSSKFLYQLTHLKLYLERLNDDGVKDQIHRIWANYFKSCISPDHCSELLKAAEFFFAIAPHNAEMEQVHSLIKEYWRNKCDGSVLDSIKGVVVTVYNFRDIQCTKFYDHLVQSDKLF